ncbi:hypothetical protein [Vibrio sp. CAU 1672]|uniref:hypothetical protein n=1 Tax=Vibrio sp. CAU 1672 TaxID=3032594 RepID=UPI0023DB351D|nr:hypothetical protein [Vibrio sp. CAU 1672]MDF2153374.1 hypothetical protein [Vibrio sp. CAU 1672]
MNGTHFKALLESVKDLTPAQKRHLICQTKMSLKHEEDITSIAELLTSEELEALLGLQNVSATK